jgi:hypothetical protein
LSKSINKKTEISKGGVPMEDLDKLFAQIPLEIGKSLEAMSKTNDIQERKLHSEIIHNLSSTMGIFLDAMDTMGLDCDDDDYYDDEDDYDEQPSKLKLSKKAGKKKREDELPF